MRVVLVSTHDEAEHIRTFFFRSERPVNYTAGQYAELTLKHPHVDARGASRWFTLSSSPTDELVSITTKRAAEHSSSFKKALWLMQPGDEIHMSDPISDFVLPKLIQTPLIFVAGGIGITPFNSILRWLSATGEQRPIKLLYGVRSEEEIIFQDTFDNAGVHATIVVSDASPAWGGERGRISAELILGFKQPSDDTLIYVSGPEPMVEALETDLKVAGVKREQLVLDFFPNYSLDY